MKLTKLRLENYAVLPNRNWSFTLDSLYWLLKMANSLDIGYPASVVGKAAKRHIPANVNKRRECAAKARSVSEVIVPLPKIVPKKQKAARVWKRTRNFAMTQSNVLFGG